MSLSAGYYVYTISGVEERSKDSLLDCHQILWVTGRLKFTAVNITNTGQLSLAWPVPLITTGLVHNVTPENARLCRVKRSTTRCACGELCGVQSFRYLVAGWGLSCSKCQQLTKRNPVLRRQKHIFTCWGSPKHFSGKVVTFRWATWEKCQ